MPDPDQDLELLRELYREWEAGNLSAGRKLLSDELVTVWPEGFPHAGTYRGPEEHRRAMREWLSAWTEFELVAEDFVRVGERIVVPFRVRARGAGSGVEVNRRWAHAWTLSAGKVTRFEVSLEPDQLLEEPS